MESSEAPAYSSREFVMGILDVRKFALAKAFASNNPTLYAAAIDGDDIAIAGLLDDLHTHTVARLDGLRRSIHWAGDYLASQGIWDDINAATKEEEELSKYSNKARANAAVLSDPTTPELYYASTQDLMRRLNELPIRETCF